MNRRVAENYQFEKAYASMLEEAYRSAAEERKRRLSSRENAEKMFLEHAWWPAVGNLNDLHPEYEIIDLKGGTRFVDYAYLPPQPFRMAIEIDGYGSHWRDVSRWKFADDLVRQNHLLISGWRLLRFAFDDIQEKPVRCQQTLLLALAKWGGVLQGNPHPLNVYERALFNLMQEQRGETTPSQAAALLGIDRHTAANNLQSLAAKQIVKPWLSKAGRTMKYTFYFDGHRAH
ncbi:DNA-binding response regulator [Paenibacillus sp. MWE-103]|uniref:DNA-binding response regulator n=1 Tax=Paenibacillus artemisiicola TaxID=1172618 RepID=A0ABS3W8A7_9BACL|nr:DNA-binding response regulator [Paenibacillus artemisiicola]MBO7744541.1 DNA-binding response regulator [Paenibacillus artemisiicola]